MEADEEGTHERLKTLLRQLVDPKVKEHRGRIVKNTGDGMLVEFGSIVDARAPSKPSRRILRPVFTNGYLFLTRH
jgi:class 3 adenylate cyclase